MEEKDEQYIETTWFERIAIGFLLGLALVIGGMLLLAGGG